MECFIFRSDWLLSGQREQLELGLDDAMVVKDGLDEAVVDKLGLDDAVVDKLGLDEAEEDKLGLDDAIGVELGLEDTAVIKQILILSERVARTQNLKLELGTLGYDNPLASVKLVLYTQIPECT